MITKMNLKDKFTFDYKGKIIQVEKTGVDVWCAIHKRNGRVDLADQLAFEDTGKGFTDIVKSKGAIYLTTVKTSDITKPEPTEQKVIEFKEKQHKIGDFVIIEQKDGSLKIENDGSLFVNHWASYLLIIKSK